MLLRHVTCFLLLVLPVVMSNIFADVIGDDPNDPSTNESNECIRNVVTHYIEHYQSEGWPGGGNPNNVTDWTPIIQDAINSLDPERGGVIFFPARRYDIDNAGKKSLFDLASDVSESDDLSQDRPQIVERLSSALREWSAPFPPSVSQTKRKERAPNKRRQ